MMQKQIPVIIFHEGCPSYLPYSVHSAEKYNSNVILLGNEENRTVAKQWFDVSGIKLDRFNRFCEVFENFSTYSDFFALICFKRYFLYYELMKIKGFDRAIIAESDLYNCANYSDIPVLNEAYAMVSTIAQKEEDLTWSSCCHCSLWTIEALDDFLNFCEETFKNNKELLNKKWDYHKKNGLAGGVCDMTMAYLWSKDKNNVLNSALVFDGGTIDQNLCDRANYTENEYKYNNLAKIKKYVLKKDESGNKVPYLVKRDNSIVKVYSIHCSGRAKAAIRYFDKSYFLVCMSQLAALAKMRLGAIKNRIFK